MHGSRLATVTVAMLLSVFAFGGTAIAAPPDPPDAVISVSNPTPAYGDTITLFADADRGGTYIRGECRQASGVVSVSSSVFNQDGEPYTDDVGLASPAWTGGAATCTFSVRLVEKWHGKTTIEGADITVEVAP